jgi:hypothetical protein
MKDLLANSTGQQQSKRNLRKMRVSHRTEEEQDVYDAGHPATTAVAGIMATMVDTPTGNAFRAIPIPFKSIRRHIHVIVCGLKFIKTSLQLFTLKFVIFKFLHSIFFSNVNETN